MKEEKKIPAKKLFYKLQERMNYKNPRLAIEALVYGWRKHPKYKSVTWSGSQSRILRDGYLWFKEDEIRSFEEYIGYPLR